MSTGRKSQAFMKFTFFFRNFFSLFNFWDDRYLGISLSIPSCCWWDFWSPHNICNAMYIAQSKWFLNVKIFGWTKKKFMLVIAFSDWQIESHSLSQIESEPICGAFVNFVLYVGCIVLKSPTKKCNFLGKSHCLPKGCNFIALLTLIQQFRIALFFRFIAHCGLLAVGLNWINFWLMKEFSKGKDIKSSLVSLSNHIPAE